MSDIFISYASEDRDRILPLVNALEKTGWSVFWDRSIPAGKTWRQFIGSEIKACRSVVVVWTEKSVTSRWVEEEAENGAHREILIPVLFDKVEPPFGFGSIQAANLAAWDGDNSSPTFSRLIADIAAILGPSPAAVKETEERRLLEAEAQRQAQEELVREQERQRSEEEARRKAEEENRRRIEEEKKLSQEAERRRREAEEQRKAEAERLRERERQRSEEEVKRKAEQENQRRIEEAANRARLREEDTQETRPDRPEHVRRSDKRQLYAGGAVISAILIAVIASLIMKEKKEEPAPPAPPPPVAYEQQKAAPPDTSSASVFRDRLKSGQGGPEMVVVPAGSFRMGDLQDGGNKTEVPVRTVKIQKPFAIGRYEVTFEEYDQFAKTANRQLPGDHGWGRGRRPVINVSWQDAVAYAKWLSEQTGKRYRLLTEAEWEYAARAGTETAYWWGKDLVKGMANCVGCGSQWDNKPAAPVGSFKPNPFGLYDTAGNVYEWVEDCWHENYNGAPVDGSAWKEAGGGDCGRRVIRGGSWGNSPGFLRASVRDENYAANRDNFMGFRRAQDLN